MVIYDLTCQLGHRFEGWFPNAEAFDKQKEMDLVACSVCGSHHVDRLPSGGHMTKIRSQAVQKTSTASAQQEMNINIDPVVFMKAVHHFIQSNFKDVGSEFTKKAIQMHRGELPAEGIYGTASEEDQERLEEEGVGYTNIPKLPDEVEN